MPTFPLITSCGISCRTLGITRERRVLVHGGDLIKVFIPDDFRWAPSIIYRLQGGGISISDNPVISWRGHITRFSTSDKIINHYVNHGEDRVGQFDEFRLLHHGKALHPPHGPHGEALVQGHHLSGHQVAFVALTQEEGVILSSKYKSSQYFCTKNSSVVSHLLG